jgi:hypothetical protein
MSEETRRVRDTLIEELRRSETLTVAGKALFARYSAMCEAESAPAPEPARPAPVSVSDDEEFGGSFMVRPTSSSNVPGYREAPPDAPRSLRDRRR